jgi:hypothetical protein
MIEWVMQSPGRVDVDGKRQLPHSAVAGQALYLARQLVGFTDDATPDAKIHAGNRWASGCVPKVNWKMRNVS